MLFRSGLDAGLAGSSIQVVETLSDAHKSPTAHKNALEAMAKHPDAAAIVGIYGYHGPAILTAVRGAGKAGQVKIVCFDEHSDTLDGIATGEIFGTVVQQPLSIGFQTITRMEKYLRGDKTQLSGGKILLSSRVITKDNVESFQATQKNFLRMQAPEK